LKSANEKSKGGGRRPESRTPGRSSVWSRANERRANGLTEGRRDRGDGAKTGEREDRHSREWSGNWIDKTPQENSM